MPRKKAPQTSAPNPAEVRSIAAFLSAYVQHGEIERAAAEAEISVDTARGYLRRKAVRDHLERMTSEEERRAFCTETSVIARLANWADGNLMDYLILKENPTTPDAVALASVKVRDMSKMPRHLQQRVKKFTVKETNNAQGLTVNFDLELHDAAKANEALAKILGIDGSDAPEDAAAFARTLHAFLREADDLGHVEDFEYPSE